MTHTESHDLLLDLAYGELPAHVAAEVSEHLEGCAECQAESAQLDGVRKAFAPIREDEELSPDFDDRVLAAARAEALLEHDGNIGQVIEGAGSFSAPSLAAASVDAHAAPVAAAPARRRPKWMTRAIVGGSAATAAALALVVGISQPARREPRPSEEYAIRVAPAAAPPAPVAAAPAAPSQAPQDAPKMASQDSSALDKAVPATSSASADLQRAKGQPARQVHAELKKKSSQRAAEAGSGGDVPTPEDPADLEHRAEAARHEGNYALAAGLYREAATGHNYNSGAAAWDLAHAVECLAAGGSFEEARKVRDRLGKLFPTEINAFAAARRALREVDATPSK
jgi:hypothetical protein